MKRPARQSFIIFLVILVLVGSMSFFGLGKGSNIPLHEARIQVVSAPAYYSTANGTGRASTELGYRVTEVIVTKETTRYSAFALRTPPYTVAEKKQFADWKTSIQREIDAFEELARVHEANPRDREYFMNQVRFLRDLLPQFSTEFSKGFPNLSVSVPTDPALWKQLTDKPALALLSTNTYVHPYDYFKSNVNRKVTATFVLANKTVSFTYPETYVYPGTNLGIATTFPEEVKSYLRPLTGLVDEAWTPFGRLSHERRIAYGLVRDPPLQ